MTLPPPYLKTISLLPAGDADYDNYPLSLPLFRAGDFRLEITRPVLILVGENGSGKSTLLEAIASAAGFSLIGGSRNHVNYDMLQAPLARHLRLSWLPKIGKGFFLRAEAMFQFSAAIDDIAVEAPEVYAGYGNKSLNTRSHGEAFLALFEHRFVAPGLYIMDEPEAALSPQRQVDFLRAVRRIEVEGRSQIILATHSVLVAAYPGAQLLSIKDGMLVPTELHDLPHFKTLYDFFYNPDAFIETALDLGDIGSES